MSLIYKKEVATNALCASLNALKSVPTFYLDELLPSKKASIKLIKAIEKVEQLYGMVYFAKVVEK